MKVYITFFAAVILLLNVVALGQINPADRSDLTGGWEQGVIISFEEEGADTLHVEQFDCNDEKIFQVVPNPDPVDKPDDYPFNTANVGMITTTACTWEGVFIDQEFLLDFTYHSDIWVDVYPPAAGRKVVVKLEDFNDNQVFKEVEMTTTVANQWERLKFDFSGTEAGKYGRVVLFMDFDSDVAGDVWYFDQVRQMQPLVTYDDGVIEDFEEPDELFWGYWSDAEFYIVDNPDTLGNSSKKVGQIFTSAQQWEGIANTEALTPLDFSEGGEFSVMAYGPADRILMFKIENTVNKGDNPIEKQMVLTKDYEWEEVFFDFTDDVELLGDAYMSGYYDRIAIFPDFLSDTEGDDWYVDDITWLGLPTAVKTSPKPTAFQFAAQNYPNPFNPMTTIDYSLPKDSHVTLAVYNVLGKKVATLVDMAKPAGAHSVQFNASDLPSGAYFYTLTTNAQTLTRKMLLVK